MPEKSLHPSLEVLATPIASGDLNIDLAKNLLEQFCNDFNELSNSCSVSRYYYPRGQDRRGFSSPPQVVENPELHQGTRGEGNRPAVTEKLHFRYILISTAHNLCFHNAISIATCRYGMTPESFRIINALLYSASFSPPQGALSHPVRQDSHFLPGGAVCRAPGGLHWP